nr:hypothetical protein [Tanacetum cinerariifolium]
MTKCFEEFEIKCPGTVVSFSGAKERHEKIKRLTTPMVVSFSPAPYITASAVKNGMRNQTAHHSGGGAILPPLGFTCMPKTEFRVVYILSPVVGSIRRIQVLDTAYWGFLRVGTKLDIFHNIIFILYFQYGVLVFWIRSIELCTLVVFGECRHRYVVSFLMDTAYWSLE